MFLIFFNDFFEFMKISSQRIGHATLKLKGNFNHFNSFFNKKYDINSIAKYLYISGNKNVGEF